MIYFLIPIFNEEKNIPNLARELNGLHSEHVHFVFVNDGSSDNSVQLLDLNFNNKTILGGEINYGPGHAFNLAFNWILKNATSKQDIIVSLEADCTSDISILSEMFDRLESGHDLVLASVYSERGNIQKVSWSKRLLSEQLNFWFRKIFRLRVRTLSSFYRAYRVGLISEINNNFPQIVSESGFTCMLEILLKSKKLGARIDEVPTILDGGKRLDRSKMKVLKTILEYLIFLFRSGKILRMKVQTHQIR